ncbi:MAG: glycosyltransferase family 2 protein [Lachnospiraceae bacterium]|nr:glycosyltransferase family 2 protein [Lachnospiraceae bacterium]
MEKILTVVVPTYNAEQYLRDNLESLCIPELLADLEILIINDGSTDGSAAIAEEYVSRYPDTYYVITKENGGHGSGINCGIQNASGRYFKVIDADDWVDQDAFRLLIMTLRSSRCDIVSSGFYWTYDEGQKNKDTFRKKAEIEIPFRDVQYQKTYEFDAIADQIYIKMHNLTIRTEILKANQIHVDEHCFYVDSEYITYPIPYVKTICFVDAFVYMYRIGRQGQSVGIEKMQRNEKNYDRVIASLLSFYSKLGHEVACTETKRRYIAGIIARVVAGKIKIMLSFPDTPQKKEELRVFDERLRTQYPDVFKANVNKAVKILRKTGYHSYSLASMLVKRKYR